VNESTQILFGWVSTVWLAIASIGILGPIVDIYSIKINPVQLTGNFPYLYL
jgi:hypothetical protein